MIKTVFFGTPQFTVNSLDSLHKDPRFEVLAVVTKPDSKIGRKQILTAPPVKQYAIENNIKVIQPLKIDEDSVVEINSLDADLYFVFSYGKILPDNLINSPKFKSINLHPSKLPKYRGATPVPEMLKNGDKETALDLIIMNDKMDEGDIIAEHLLPVEPEDNATTLFEKIAKTTESFVPDSLFKYCNNELQAVQQDHSKATYCGKISKQDAKLDFKNQSAAEIVNLTRAYHIWPNTYALLNNKRIKFYELQHSNETLNPGLCHVQDNQLFIGTKTTAIKPIKLQIEGKSKMDISDFLKGFSHISGETLN